MNLKAAIAQAHWGEDKQIWSWLIELQDWRRKFQGSIEGKYKIGDIVTVGDSENNYADMKAEIIDGPFPYPWTEQGMEGNYTIVIGYTISAENGRIYDFTEFGFREEK